jgi:adenylate cyclase
MATVTDDLRPFPEKLTRWQRMGLRQVRRRAGRRRGEPLSAEDWPAMWAFEHSASGRATRWMWRKLPATPRCTMCKAPFAGVGRLIVGPLGHKPSRKNPHICSTCIELSPPGGMTMLTGVLFADIRGYTTAAELSTPDQTVALLRRFYGAAEDALFPEAIIDKLIGDEVMALYLTPILQDVDIPALMVEHARALLGAIGYGSPEGPFVEVGIGLDYGPAFVGNIGDRAVYDFTAIGDIVNTASRLQHHARSGEILASSRIVGGDAGGERVEVELKGKSTPEVAYRLGRV